MSGLLLKQAAPAYDMAGTLFLSQSGWVLLTVPNALVRGVFDAMDEPGLELPPSGPGGKLDAHISVIRPSELESIGGADKLTERGHTYRYSLDGLHKFDPKGWEDMSKCWVIQVKSPELEKLRKSYGLSKLPNDNKHRLHITVAVRRKNVLGPNDVRKAAIWLPAVLAAGAA